MAKKLQLAFVPKKAVKKPKRKLGILEGKSKVLFINDFEISADEFLDL